MLGRRERLPCDKRRRLRDVSQSHSSVNWPRPRGGVIFQTRLLPGDVDGEFAVADPAGKALDEFRYRVLAIGADELGKGGKQAGLRQAVAVDAVVARFGPGLVEIAQCGLFLLVGGQRRAGGGVGNRLAHETRSGWAR